MRILRVALVTVGAVVLLLAGSATALLTVLSDNDYRHIAIYLAERATGRAVTIEGPFSFHVALEPSLTASDVRVANPPWASQPDLARIGHLKVQLALRPLLSGTLLIPRLLLEDTDFELERDADGTPGWVIPPGKGGLVPVLGTLTLRNVAWHYRDHATETETSVALGHLTIQDVGNVARLDGEGTWDGRKIGAKGEFGTLAQALDPTRPFPIDLLVSLPALELTLHGTMADPVAGQGLDLRLKGQSDNIGELMELLHSDLPLAGHLDGEAKLSGELAALRVSDLHFSVVQDQGREPKPNLEITGQIGAIRPYDAVLLEGIDCKVQVATSTAVSFSWLKREVPDLGRVEGRFAVTGSSRALSLADLDLRVGSGDRLTVAATGAVDDIRLWPDVAVRGVALRLEARTPSTASLANVLGVRLPELGALRASGRLTGGLDRLDLEGIDLSAGPPERPVRVTGRIDNVLFLGPARASAAFESDFGALLGWALDRKLPALGAVRARAELADIGGRLRLEGLEATAGNTDVLWARVAGVIGDSASSNRSGLDIEVTARDLTILGTMLDVSIPALGPFSFKGRLEGDLETPRLAGKARLGRTDIDETLHASFAGARPWISGELATPVLYLADLGIRPNGPWQQKAAANGAPPPVASGKATSLAALRTLDLSLRVRIDQLEGTRLSVDRARLNITLQDGVLYINSSSFDLLEGSADLDATLDTSVEPPGITLDATANDLRLGDLLAQLESDVPIEGELDLHTALKTSGRSLRDLTAALDGEFGMAIERGRIHLRYFGLTGANLVQWLFAGAPLRSSTDLRCFVARFGISRGVATSQSLFMDTSLVRSTGAGTLNLVDGTIDVLVHPQPTRAELVRLTTPYRIVGPLSDPSVEISRVGLAGRAIGELALSPINLLGSLTSLVSDWGSDQKNPCLTWTQSGTAAGGRNRRRSRRGSTGLRAMPRRRLSTAAIAGRPPGHQHVQARDDPQARAGPMFGRIRDLEADHPFWRYWRRGAPWRCGRHRRLTARRTCATSKAQ